MTTQTDLSAWAATASAELVSVLDGIDPAEIQALCDAIAQARRIVLHGVGREGLMMRALTMRLFHLGLSAMPLGDMATPPVGPGDLLVVSAGPGAFTSIHAFMQIAHAAGARVALLTAEPNAPLRDVADLTVLLPARTMARASESPASLPMGSAYEGAMFLVFEFVVARLATQLGVAEADMRARHTNLE